MFNFDSLRYLVTDVKVLDSIRARQLSALNLDATRQFLPELSETVESYLIDYTNSHPSIFDVEEMRQKIRTKWWCEQGRPPDLNKVWAALETYSEPREVTLAPLDNYDDFCLRHIFKSWIEAVNAEVAQDVSLRNSWSAVYTLLKKRPKSNTGWFEFTSDQSRDHGVLVDACRLASMKGSKSLDPVIQWYRDMRNKMRCVFGVSLVDQANYYRHLDRFLRVPLYRLTSVNYCAPLEMAQRIADAVRVVPKRTDLIGFEGDFDSMDTTVSWELTHHVLTELLAYTNVSADVREELLTYLYPYFHNVPLCIIGTDTVRILKTVNLLSGVSITNPLENLINLYVIARAWAKCLRSGFDLTLSAFVMGDDSALLISGINPQELAQEFRIAYSLVSSNCGMTAKVEKMRISGSSIWFCRRNYPIRDFSSRKMVSKGVCQPIYPIDFCLNSIFRPENQAFAYEATDSDANRSKELARQMQIFDNAVGDPAWKAVVTFYFQQTAKFWKGILPSKPKSSWREKVYGCEPWEAGGSPTFALYIKIFNL